MASPASSGLPTELCLRQRVLPSSLFTVGLDRLQQHPHGDASLGTRGLTYLQASAPRWQSLLPTLLFHLVLPRKSHVVDGLRQAKMTMTKVAQFSAIHSSVEHEQVNPGVYGVEHVCSTKVLSFFKYQSANMESAMEQEVPEGGEQKSDVAVIADLFSLKNVPPTHFSLTGCVVLFGAIL
ncbi:uncharacterized protein [Triticum aestivum]|uniref:uncharacterized protein isoform X1 n=1 Tax=Triticum aestivum TaxID=4565 RepID=UPI001D0035E1|nr:uncharacterized protein LOC123135782 isoform X1 [Triticum aestivum]XP_044410928.1 uncharacterized protein LOC123135782 isoform X1 [Triticum aestivum]